LTGARGIVVTGAVATALVGCGSSSRHAGSALDHAERQPTTPAPRTVSAARPAPRASPALVALRRALSAKLGAAGPGAAAVVYDVTSGHTLFALRSGAKRPPASVEKLYTSVAVLTELGPDARLETQVWGAGHLGPGGVWHGDLYLRGGGDPTFGDGGFNRVWEDGYGPSAGELAAQLREHGIRRVTGRVIGDASLFDALPGGPATGYAPDINDIGGELAALTYDHGATAARLSPGAFAARELARTLRASGVRASAAPFTATAPSDAPVLASVSSPTMSVLLRLTDVPSDDFFAEMLTKQLGVRFGTGGSTAAGAAVISGVIARYGVHPVIVDGSGLSRHDGSSALEVVDLLRSLWTTPTGAQLRAALPVVGINGTVRQIGVRSGAKGRCLAKTGTLNHVTNLAGYCHAAGGHVLAFALFLDGPDNFRGTVLLGGMVGAVARY
jgi:D-alanyl-D-alanine carboxypeptidase/D-alanyl-D-alanine-endopeptidase (penicillin-binding protein 4)